MCRLDDCDRTHRYAGLAPAGEIHGSALATGQVRVIPDAGAGRRHGTVALLHVDPHPRLPIHQPIRKPESHRVIELLDALSYSTSFQLHVADIGSAQFQTPRNLPQGQTSAQPLLSESSSVVDDAAAPVT